MAKDKIKIKFWGVRGSIPTPGKSTLKYGGNTACVQVTCGDTLLIFDAGSGIRVLGQELMKQMPIEAHLLFSHYHQLCQLKFQNLGLLQSWSLHWEQ